MTRHERIQTVQNDFSLHTGNRHPHQTLTIFVLSSINSKNPIPLKNLLLFFLRMHAKFTLVLA